MDIRAIIMSSPEFRPRTVARLVERIGDRVSPATVYRFFNEKKPISHKSLEIILEDLGYELVRNGKPWDNGPENGRFSPPYKNPRHR